MRSLFLLIIIAVIGSSNSLNASKLDLMHGTVVYPEKYPLNIYKLESKLPDEKRYLENVLLSLLFDQLAIQRTAQIPRQRPQSIVYPVQDKDYNAIEDPYSSMVKKYPASTGIYPIERKKTGKMPKELLPSAFHITSQVEITNDEQIAFSVQLFFEKDELFNERSVFKEDELVAALSQLSSQIRKKLNGDTGAHLKAVSSPDRASVYIDNMFIGKTPLEEKWLPPGDHIITFKKEGFSDITKKVSLINNRSVEIDGLFSEALSSGSLDIDVDPPSEVYIGVEYKGKSPLLINHIEEGRHRLKISSVGYVDKYIPVDIKSGQTKRIRTSLIPGSTEDFYNPRPEVFFGFTYADLSKGALYSSVVFLGASLYSLVRKDRIREEMYRDLSTLDTTQYTQNDLSIIQNSMSRQNDYQLAADIFGAGALVSLGAAIYFFVKDAFTRDIDYAFSVSGDERNNSNIGNVQVKTMINANSMNTSVVFSF